MERGRTTRRDEAGRRRFVADGDGDGTATAVLSREFGIARHGATGVTEDWPGDLGEGRERKGLARAREEQCHSMYHNRASSCGGDIQGDM